MYKKSCWQWTGRPQMNYTFIDSTLINSIGYEFHENLLEIRFNDGQSYRYKNVPEQLYKKLLNSTSKNDILEQIKYNYPSERITDAPQTHTH